jgi:glycine hydroxymethyltransferase
MGLPEGTLAALSVNELTLGPSASAFGAPPHDANRMNTNSAKMPLLIDAFFMYVLYLSVGFLGLFVIMRTMKDTQIEKLIAAEKARQKKVVNLIASENIVSDDVLKALGSVLTNKYAEGYPGKRYYGGNEVIDKIESLAIARALKLFGLKASEWHVNVQALSGSPANLAVFLGLVPQGGKIMGMSLSHGGHLTHGQKVSATGKFWTSVPYGVDEKTEVIDYDALKALAIKEKPAIIVSGFTAYPRAVDFKKFREIADACGAILMTDMSHFAGLVAGKVYASPFTYADVVTTTVHKTLRGPRSALIFVKKDAREFDKKIDKAVFPGLQGGPHENQIAAVAVALREAATPAFKAYAKQVVKNANVLASELGKHGWKIISGGTDSHLILVDTYMGGKGISGKEASDRLEKVGIIVNKNTIPGETRSPMDPSGIRLGTASETTRGRKERDMVKLAARINDALRK